MTNPPIAVRVRGIAKSFGGTRILDNITVEIQAGTVHALVGENGAGKSSLGKIIGGYYTPDEGEVEIHGARVARFSPRDALGLGVAMIHQELQLAPEAQRASRTSPRSRKRARRRAGARRHGALRGAGKDLRFRHRSARQGRASLRIAERQKVEIMRAIARDAQIIIMDEPTLLASPRTRPIGCTS